MSSRVMISGSMAYDTIMVFDGHFKDHILPERIHMLNVSFFTPRLKREFGGCAANIAYTLHGLGGDARVLASVGRDGYDYVERLRGLGMDVSRILVCDDHYTAQAYITTDLSDNQITAFHPGAMGQASRVDASGDACWAIVAPNDKLAMQAHAQAFTRAGVPWIFDPGQALPAFDGAELRALLKDASALAVNDYECRMLSERTGLTEAELAAQVQAMIVTKGAEGSVLHRDGQSERIAPVSIREAVDPTGCGDAYRGCLLYGLSQGLGWSASVKLGSVMGAIKIEHEGPQNHVVDRAEVVRRHQQAYGMPPWTA
ncbi:MAG: carbohydrate kinase family protein [Burkholderiaceae bacterium]